ncbi:MAG: hypothetical protein QXN55_00670 [Candidatus Nitrosotenuis sp.]
MIKVRSIISTVLLSVAVLLTGCNDSSYSAANDPLYPCLSRGYDYNTCSAAYSVYGVHDSHWMDGVGPFVAGMGAMTLLNNLNAQPRYQTPQYQSYYNAYQSNPNQYVQRTTPKLKPESYYKQNPVKVPPAADGRPQALFQPNTIAAPRAAASGLANGVPPMSSQKPSIQPGGNSPFAVRSPADSSATGVAAPKPATSNPFAVNRSSSGTPAANKPNTFSVSRPSSKR